MRKSQPKTSRNEESTNSLKYANECIEPNLQKESFVNPVEFKIIGNSKSSRMQEDTSHQSKAFADLSHTKVSFDQNDNVDPERNISEFVTICLEKGFKEKTKNKGKYPLFVRVHVSEPKM